VWCHSCKVFNSGTTLTVSNTLFLFARIKVIRILRLRIAEIKEKFKNNARLELYQDLEFLYL